MFTIMTKNVNSHIIRFTLLILLALSNSAWADGIKIALRADDGMYAGRCNNCVPGGAYPNSMFVHVPEAQLGSSPWAHFTIEHLSNGKYAFKSDIGHYAGRCNNCIPGGAYPNSMFVHVTDLNTSPWGEFTLQLLANGKYALQADSGEYVGRCNNCVPGGAYPNSAFVHVKDLNASPWAQWDLIILP